MHVFSGKILDLRKLEVISWAGRQIDTNDSLVQRRQIETDVVGKSKLMLSEASGPENTIRSFLIIARPDPWLGRLVGRSLWENHFFEVRGVRVKLPWQHWWDRHRGLLSMAACAGLLAILWPVNAQYDIPVWPVPNISAWNFLNTATHIQIYLCLKTLDRIMTFCDNGVPEVFHKRVRTRQCLMDEFTWPWKYLAARKYV